MDEPTNDLDTESLELLEDRLVEYDGTLLVVSHDRAFLNNVVTSMIVFEPTGIKEYVGGYDDWLRQSQASKREEIAVAKSREAKPNGSGAVKSEAMVKKLTFKERSELEKIPATIEKYESEQSALFAMIADEAYFKKGAAAQSADQKRLKELASLIENSYARWEELAARES
jgi:ATP-binding cassette subfamily F protein uup